MPSIAVEILCILNKYFKCINELDAVSFTLPTDNVELYWSSMILGNGEDEEIPSPFCVLWNSWFFFPLWL